MKTKLPDNSTSWQNTCRAASDFANRCGAGQLSFAESFLAQNGWEHFGIETVDLPEAGKSLSYLNTGETYTPTVCQETQYTNSINGPESESGPCFVSSWGDWFETAEQKYCQENGVIRCSNCGEFTPVHEPWDQTICENCGLNVAG